MEGYATCGLSFEHDYHVFEVGATATECDGIISQEFSDGLY